MSKDPRFENFFEDEHHPRWHALPVDRSGAASPIEPDSPSDSDGHLLRGSIGSAPHESEYRGGLAVAERGANEAPHHEEVLGSPTGALAHHVSLVGHAPVSQGDHELREPAGDDFGFGHSGWGDADSFDSLFAHLPAGMGGAPFIFAPIDHLTINDNTFITNNVTQNINVVFNAGNGGEIDVDGDVNTVGVNTGQITLNELHQSSSGQGPSSELGWSDGSWDDAGGFDAVLFGHMPGAGNALVIMPVNHLDINHNTFVHNTAIENTNVLFNAGNGGDIDIGGDVNTISSNQALIDASATHQHFV